MTATLTQVRQAIATVLGAIDGLSAHPFEPGSITPPAALVHPAPGAFLDYQVTMDAAHDLRLVVLIVVQPGEEQSWAEQLDAFIADEGASSIFAAIDANQTLGDLVDGCHVTVAQDYGTYTVGGADYPGVEFAVEVLL